jgi:integrase/recombinase XerD
MWIDEPIAEFLEVCAVERQLSENTIQAYRSDLCGFRAWLARSDVPVDISTATLKSYLQVMVTERHLAVATVRRRMACLRAFFRRLSALGFAADPFSGWQPTLPRRKRLPRALSRTELRSLFSISGKHSRLLHGPWRTSVRLMLATGLRVGELCKVRVEDVSPDGATLRVHGKGSRDRVAYITDEALREELRYSLKYRRAYGPSAPLFVNRLGRELRPESIRLRLHRAAEAAGLSRRITPHMLRHTAATLLIETGIDIRIVQRLLGHSSIATTEIYTHISDETLRISLERANVFRQLEV